MNRDTFIGASISTRIYEDNLLNQKDLERLNEFDTLDEVLNSLNDSIYEINELDRSEDYEIILARELKRAYDVIRDVSPDKNIGAYLIEKYNFHNLKVLLKEYIQGEDYRSIYSKMGDIDIDLIKRELGLFDEGKKDLDDEDDFYLKAAFEALDAYRQNEDPAMIDISLDKAYYEKLLKLAYEISLDSLISYTKESIDLVNVKTLLRIQNLNLDLEELDKAVIDGGNIKKESLIEMFKLKLDQIRAKLSNYDIGAYTGRTLSVDKPLEENILDLEKVIDDHFMDFAKKAKQITYGPEILLAYLIAKENEIKNLRIIFVSKLNGLSKEFSKERLRECIN